jgi:hypothetical protein
VAIPLSQPELTDAPVVAPCIADIKVGEQQDRLALEAHNYR